MSSISEATEIRETARSRAWHEWLAIGEGVTALLSICALIVSFAALSSSGSSASAGTAGASAASPGSMPGMSMGGATPVAAASSGVKQSFSVTYKSDVEHAKKGPDGTWHDAGLPGIYTVKPGANVTVTLYNYDTSPHSFTAPGLGADQVVPSGSPTNPARVSFTFNAPAKAGRYEWWCKFPCDPWAMTHNGYMRGYVTVKA